MKKSIQIGISDFKKLIEENNYFVDKSMLIKEFIENGADIILTPRPRRFGKTLNLSMIKYFFDIRTKEETKKLFDGLKIENEKEIMKLQGEYPVIFISFKNLKHINYKDFVDGIIVLIFNLYREYEYLLESDKLTKLDKKKYQKILNEDINAAELQNSINDLIYYLNKHYRKKVMLFIDEYDVPIQEAYMRGYYNEMIVLIRNILTSALKDNIYLEKSLITGILRVAKESIFSGLNNLEVNTILGYDFNEKFGFSEEEIEQLLNYYNVMDDIENIKKWYNGYIFGGEIIYNPWSVLNYLKKRREGFMPYWINSSSNDLIKRLLLKGDNNMKLELEELIEGKSISKVIDDSIVMSEVEDSNENIWSFLLMSGYLKAIKTENIRGRLYCDLKIPNEEIHIFYENLIKKWFLETLTNLSYFDVSGKEPERVYHAFVLGMLVSLSENYEVKSNKESGYGRYDVMIIPKNISKIGIIIEFKKIDDFLDDTLEEATTAALKQIEDKKYETELLEKKVKDIVKLAIVFKGKEIKITQGNK